MQWRRNTDGSVSIYFMIVLSALVLFGSVFVDFARIHTAELRHQAAVQAAARSLHSSYIPELQAYGLYGLNAAAASPIYKEVLLRNLASPGVTTDNGSWIELQLDVESIHMAFDSNLAEHETFKKQVLEEMKYRAPIEYMFGIYDKLRETPALDYVQQASTLSKRLKKLEDLVQKRERSLDSAWSQMTSLVGPTGFVQTAHEGNRSSLAYIEELAQQLKSHTVDSLEESRRGLEAEIEQLLRSLTQISAEIARLSGSEEGEDHSSRLEELRDSQAHLENQLASKRSSLDSVKALLQTAFRFAEEIGKHKVSIELQNAELQRRMERIQRQLNEARDWNEQLKAEVSGLDEEFHESVPILDPAYFDQLTTGIGAIVSIHHGYVRQFDALKLLSGEDFSTQYENLIRMNGAIAAEAARFYSEQEPKERLRQEQRKAAEQQQEAEKGRAQGILDQVAGALTSCSPGSEMNYVRLSELEQQYHSVNTQTKAAESNEPFELPDDPEKAGSRSMSFVERIQGALLSVRDSAYLNEYALTKFNYRTIPEQSYEFSKPLSHPLARQEAEYILYGFSSCYLNQIAAYGEMFMIRLSIRTMEALLQPNKSILSIASPWLVYLWALAEGAIKAYQDMEKLVAGEEVELSARLPKKIALNYKDYLRLFMLVHGNEARMMSRMQALVQLNTGVDLAKTFNSASIRSESRLKLWFLPEAVQVLGRTVEKGSVRIDAETFIAY